MKLNLGCGDDIKEGYINVDFRKTSAVVLECDLSKRPWPFDDESADEILMLDFLEHFGWNHTDDILTEAWRILKPGASLVIQVPDFEQLSNAVNMNGDYHCSTCGYRFKEADDHLGMCVQCKTFRATIAREAVRRLYGGQDYVGNYHMTAFTPQLLGFYLGNSFGDVEYLEEDHQRRNWNFKIRVKKKTDIW